MTSLAAHGRAVRVSWFVGLAFAVLGVVSELANMILGLNPTSWLLLAVVSCTLGIMSLVSWAMRLYLHSLKAQKENK